MKHILTLLLLFALQHASFGQTKKEEAYEKAREAVALMDKKQYDDAILLLKEAIKLDPDNYNYPYELGYSYHLKGNTKKAIDVFQDVIEMPEATDQCFQMLGNFYSIDGNPDKAFKTYETGLKKFPKSGRLYLETGNVYLGQEKYNEAITNYEKGIEVDPTYPSNYYRAAKLYFNSTDEVWGMLYGEIFMNLERNSGRTKEISKLLYDTYRREIKFTSDSSISVSFSSNTISISDPENFKLPFGLMVYEPLLSVAVAFEKEINLASLDRVRTNFLNSYSGQSRKDYPNALFDYQQTVKDAGHLEAYNHWILMMGDEAQFDAWYKQNTVKWDDFVAWFTKKPLELSEENRFYRNQY